MRIDWDAPIEMDDGAVLRCDVFRPDGAGKYPVILAAGPYGKWLSFQDEVWGGQWKMLCRHEPEILRLSSNKYQNYEFSDPERFVPDGYALVRVDVRGTGRSPGLMDLLGVRETLGSLPMHRMGGQAALVDGKGWTQRRLLSGNESMAGCGAAAASPDCDVHLGGVLGFLSRVHPTRRDLLPLR